MRYYLDTEFHEQSMTMISVGLVDQTGRRFYGVNTRWLSEKETNWSLSSQWLEENVVPHLFPEQYVRTAVPGGHHEGREGITYVEGNEKNLQAALREWCNLDQADEGHEFWAYYADWDWVLFRRLFGSFDDMPMALPLLCLDLKQLALSAGIKAGLSEMVKQSGPHHCALADAEWCKLVHEMFILQYQRDV